MIYDEKYVINDISKLFLFQKPIFDNLQNYISDSLYKKFINACLSWWIVETYYAEITATIIYKDLLNRCDECDFTIRDKKYIIKYLEQTSIEESIHADSLRNLIHTHTSKIIPDHYNNKETVNTVLENYKDKNFYEILSLYYIRESALFATFRLFYNNVTNNDLRKLLKMLMQDEAEHHALLLKIVKKFLPNLTVEQKNSLKEMYYKEVAKVAQHQLNFFQKYFKINLSKRSNLDLYTGAYNGEYEIKYREFLYPKLFKFINCLDKNYEYKTFEQEIDRHTLSMLQF